MKLPNTLDQYRSHFEKGFRAVLPRHSSNKLHEAMCYSTLNGGKRLRPLLVYATGRSLNGPLSLLDAPAFAVELVHSFSLIHDDLPSMDDDDLRRGKPTCHKVFGEAVAILAGDALQALAFEVLSCHGGRMPLSKRIKLIALLAQAVGYQGMELGQTLDILSSKSPSPIPLTYDQLFEINQRKTGALIKASLLSGVIIAEPRDGTLFSMFSTLGDKIGHLFQVQDDIFDIEGSPSHIGKKTQKDFKQGKITYPNLVGIKQAKDEIKKLSEEILQTLNSLKLDSPDLEDLIQSISNRSF